MGALTQAARGQYRWDWNTGPPRWLRTNLLHAVIGLPIKTCLERRREKGPGRLWTMLKKKPFVINSCLLSDTLALPSADGRIKGSPWANMEGRWGQDMARRLGRDGWQGPESPQIVMKAVLTQGAAEKGRACAGGTATGEKMYWISIYWNKTRIFLYVWRKNWHWKQLGGRWQKWSRAWKSYNIKRSRKDWDYLL